MRVHRGDEGAAAVEFALLFPLFLVIVLGVVTMGFGFDQKINLTQTAREASRYGATLSIAASAPGNSGTVETWLANVTQVAVAAGGAHLAEDRPGRFVCVAYVGDGATQSLTTTDVATPGTEPCVEDDGRPADEVRVQVVVRSETELDFLLYGGGITVGSDAVSHFEAGA